MIYTIHKHTNYQDIGNKRIDVGLYYIEEKDITNPKDIALFGSKCCQEFLDKDVFFDDKIGAYSECAKRNIKVLYSFLSDVMED